MFGRVLDITVRPHVMRKFLRALAKDDVGAVETAEKFCAAWGILPTSDNVTEFFVIAQEYSDELSSLGNSIYKWCERRTLDLAPAKTKLLDLAMNAGLVPMASSQKDSLCVGYSKWRAAPSPKNHTTEPSTAVGRTMLFYSEVDRVRAKEKVNEEKAKAAEEAEAAVAATRTTKELQTGSTTPSKATTLMDITKNIFFENSEEEEANAATAVTEEENELWTRPKSFYVLPNWAWR